jgi:hypothetical protein
VAWRVQARLCCASGHCEALGCVPAAQVHGTCLGMETLAVILTSNYTILGDFDVRRDGRAAAAAAHNRQLRERSLAAPSRRRSSCDTFYARLTRPMLPDTLRTHPCTRSRSVTGCRMWVARTPPHG